MSQLLNIPIPTALIQAFCRCFCIEELSLFGSVLREDFGPDSDIDVMLKFLPGHGFTFENTPEIHEQLQQIFNRPVDVIEKGKGRKAIMDSYQAVYAA